MASLRLAPRLFLVLPNQHTSYHGALLPQLIHWSYSLPCFLAWQASALNNMGYQGLSHVVL
jgi:hypothetical protein